MELRQYLNVITKWWWLIIASVVVAGLASYFTTRAMPLIFQARTTLVVGQVMQNPNPDYSEFYTGQVLGQSYADLSKREPVLQGALDVLKLKWEWTQLQSMVTSRVIPNTQLIEISIVDTDPQRVAALTREVANQLILNSPAATSVTKQSEQEFTLTQIADLKAKLQKAQVEVRRYDDEIATASSARQIQELTARQSALQNQIGSWQSTYAQLLLTVQKGSQNSLNIVEAAQVPTSPVGPNTTNNTVMAAVIGLILAGGAAFLLEFIDDTVKDNEAVRRSLGLETLGAIATIDSREYPEKLAVTHYPFSPIAEAYRMLRTNLQFSSVDKPLRSMLLTSAKPLEGKSYTTANLAAIIAQSGKRVILVDADMRRPTQHLNFKLTNNAGLTTVLLDMSINPADIVQDVGIENLRVMTAGPLPPNPAELLGSKRMTELIASLLQISDLVVFDTPPVLAVADATILSSHVDGVLLVVDASKTRRAIAQKAKTSLASVGARMLGVTLNRIPARSNAAYDYSYYSSDGKRTGKQSRRSKKASTYSNNGNNAPAKEVEGVNP
jgi:polysaccharide biosynthesis transport protein